MNQVRVYVDGFNLYHGLRRDGRRYLWLDLDALAVSLLKPGQHLDSVQYFSAPVRNDPAGHQRQTDCWGALLAHSPRVTLVEGRFQQKTRSCNQCGTQWTTYEEKETDVSIAVTLVEDGVLDGFDTALVISADSDPDQPKSSSSWLIRRRWSAGETVVQGSASGSAMLRVCR